MTGTCDPFKMFSFSVMQSMFRFSQCRNPGSPNNFQQLALYATFEFPLPPPPHPFDLFPLAPFSALFVVVLISARPSGGPILRSARTGTGTLATQATFDLQEWITCLLLMINSYSCFDRPKERDNSQVGRY